MVRTKISVSFPISEPSLGVLIQCNSKLSRLGRNWITFGESGTSSPHLTIAMGSLASEETLEDLVGACQRAASELVSEVVFRFGNPYLEDVTGRYVLAPVELGKQTKTLRLDLRAQLLNHFIEVARMNDQAHVTLASFDEENLVPQGFFVGIPPIPECRCDHIDIARGGKKGAKGELLARVELGTGRIQRFDS